LSADYKFSDGFGVNWVVTTSTSRKLKELEKWFLMASLRDNATWSHPIAIVLAIY
jgi:hypothetical protein